MKHICLLLDDPTLAPSDLHLADACISLRAVDRGNATTLVDGEQAYALYELTEQADDLAMEWARAVHGALASTSWRLLFVYRDIDLQPLVINRLFRGFFLDRTRIYLGVQRILETEAPQAVIVHSASHTDALFAQAACLDAGVEFDRYPLSTAARRRVRVPEAFQTFLRDIAAPALKHPFSTPRFPTDGAAAPRIVFVERGGVGSQMVVDAFEALHAKRDVATTVVCFESKDPTRRHPRTRYTTISDYQNLAHLLHLLAYQARVMAGRHAARDWSNAVLSLVEPDIRQIP